MGDRARDDPLGVVVLGTDVYAQAVQGHALLDTDAHGGDFFIFHPHPRIFGVAVSNNPEGLEGVQDDLLQETNILSGRPVVAGQVDDRIDHELPRTVVRDVASPVRVDQRYPSLGHLFPGDQESFSIALPAQGDDRRVLKKIKGVFPLLGLYFTGSLFLQFQGLGIIHEPKVSVSSVIFFQHGKPFKIFSLSTSLNSCP